MAKAMVKCPYCGQTFDRNNPDIKWVKVGRRYAHETCYQKKNLSMSQEERDLEALYQYIKALLGEDFVYVKVKKQIDQFHKQYGYTYSGMLSSLKYFYEVKRNSKEKAMGGIGIIPYIYKEAYDYYYNIYKAQQKNESVSCYKSAVREITIQSPRSDAPRPHLWLEDDKE